MLGTWLSSLCRGLSSKARKGEKANKALPLFRKRPALETLEDRTLLAAGVSAAFFADVNGDTRDDLIYQAQDSSLWLAPSSGTGFERPVLAMPADTWKNVFFADVTGDRRADLIIQAQDDSLWLAPSAGNAFKFPRLLKPAGDWVDVHFADVNGDRRADLTYQAPDNSLWLGLSTGKRFERSRPVMPPGDYQGLQLADVNGDRRADLTYQAPDNSLWLGLSTGKGFRASGQVLPSADRRGIRFADFDGDRRADLLFQGPDDNLWLSPSTETGFGTPLQIHPDFGDGNPSFVDVNGDRLADLVVHEGDNSIRVAPGTGAGFENLAQVLQLVDPRLGDTPFALPVTGFSTTGSNELGFLASDLPHSQGFDQNITIQMTESGPLIGMDVFRADPRFAGIDGRGSASVIIDTGIDPEHSFFGPDADSNGVADRIVFQRDFADGDDDATDVNGHGTHVPSILASQDPTSLGIAPRTDIIHLKVFENNQGAFSL